MLNSTCRKRRNPPGRRRTGRPDDTGRALGRAPEVGRPAAGRLVDAGRGLDAGRAVTVERPLVSPERSAIARVGGRDLPAAFGDDARRVVDAPGEAARVVRESSA